MKRQDGHYWVCMDGSPTIAFWCGKGWWTPGNDFFVTDEYMDEIDETPIVRNTLLDLFTDRHTRIEEMIRNALGHSVCALIDSMNRDDAKQWLVDNGYKLTQEPGRAVLTHNGVTIGEVLA